MITVVISGCWCPVFKGILYVGKNWYLFPLYSAFPCFFKKFYLFFNWRIIALQILFFSVKPQYESATGIYISLPFWTSFPSPSPSHPSRLIQSPCLFPEPYSKFPLAIYFAYGNVSFHVALSIHLALSSPLLSPCP